MLDDVIRYESGEMNQEEVVGFFQALVDMGVLQHFQGSYQRVARDLAQAGLITLG